MENYKFTITQRKRIFIEVTAPNGLEAEKMAKNLLLIQEPNIEEIYNDVIIEFIDLERFDAMTAAEWDFWKNKI